MEMKEELKDVSLIIDESVKIKKVKIVVRDLRKEISGDKMKQYLKEFEELKMKEIKQEEPDRIKLDPDDDSLFLFEKTPKVPKIEMKSESRSYTDKKNLHHKKAPTFENMKVIRQELKGSYVPFSDHQCKVCEKFLATAKGLIQHTKHHYIEPATFECEKCKKNFATNYLLKIHVCGPVKPSKCPHCDASFAHAGDIKKHLKNVHNLQLFDGNFSCDHCGDFFNTKGYLQAHVKKCSKKIPLIFFCDHCERNFNAKKHLNKHIKSHFEKECKICHLTFKMGSFDHHMRRMHSTKVFKCQKCPKTFKCRSALNDHSKYHEKNIECSECFRKFSSIGALNMHMKFHENPERFRCYICGYQAKSQSTLKTHYQTHDEDREKKYKCNQCDFKSCHKTSLKIHVKLHDPEEISKRCPSSFATHRDAQLHFQNCSRRHRYLSCDKCEKKFMSKNQMTSHVLSHAMHKIKCEKCEFKMKPGSLKFHMKEFHPISKEEFQCKQCSIFCKNKKDFKVHMRTHEATISCKECALKFTNQFDLEAHMKFHKNSSKLRCQICNHQFTERGNLRRHMKLHEGSRERKYECNQCEKKFYTSSHLKGHMRYHKSLNEKLRNNPKAVKCEKCSSVLRDKYKYTQHLRFAHSNREKFQCNFCGLLLSTKQTLKNHFLGKHLIQ